MRCVGSRSGSSHRARGSRSASLRCGPTRADGGGIVMLYVMLWRRRRRRRRRCRLLVARQETSDVVLYYTWNTPSAARRSRIQSWVLSHMGICGLRRR